MSIVGKIVETALKEALFYDPKHPYTEAQLSAMPIPDPKKNKRGQITTRSLVIYVISKKVRPLRPCRFVGSGCRP